MIIAVAATVTAMFLPGCQAPTPPTSATQMVLHVPDYEAFVDASLSMLRRYDFTPDRVDRTRGLIISHPTTSGQWFEWWRVDSLGGYQTLEASLHTTRRIVTINIEPVQNAAADLPVDRTEPEAPARVVSDQEQQPAEPSPADTPVAGDYRVTVQVDKSRYSAPERQVTNSAGALALYSERTPTVEGLRGRQTRRAHWVPLGRDGLLESFFLGKLASALPDVEPAE